MMPKIVIHSPECQRQMTDDVDARHVPHCICGADPTPASPRVAEELVEQAATMLDAAAFAPEVMGNFSWEDQRNNARRKAIAIITLAQDAVLREVAEWCNNKAGEAGYIHVQDVAAKCRAMMVKT